MEHNATPHAMQRSQDSRVVLAESDHKGHTSSPFHSGDGPVFDHWSSWSTSLALQFQPPSNKESTITNTKATSVPPDCLRTDQAWLLGPSCLPIGSNGGHSSSMKSCSSKLRRNRSTSSFPFPRDEQSGSDVFDPPSDLQSWPTPAAASSSKALKKHPDASQTPPNTASHPLGKTSHPLPSTGVSSSRALEDPTQQLCKTPASIPPHQSPAFCPPQTWTPPGVPADAPLLPWVLDPSLLARTMHPSVAFPGPFPPSLIPPWLWPIASPHPHGSRHKEATAFQGDGLHPNDVAFWGEGVSEGEGDTLSDAGFCFPDLTEQDSPTTVVPGDTRATREDASFSSKTVQLSCSFGEWGRLSHRAKAPGAMDACVKGDTRGRAASGEGFCAEERGSMVVRGEDKPHCSPTFSFLPASLSPFSSPLLAAQHGELPAQEGAVAIMEV